MDTSADIARNSITVFLTIIVLLIAVIVGAVFWITRSPNYRGGRKIKVTETNAPVLLAVLSKHGMLALLADGYTPNDMWYSYVMGLGLIYSPRPIYGLYSVELPFMSAAHIVGVSHGDSLPVKIQVNDSALEEMVLEGDYPNYFSLYVDHGEQSSGRYVLDPKAMAYTVDFCKQYNWEIVGDTLFFLSSSELPTYELVDNFVQEIRPAVDIGEHPPERHSHDLPYVTIQPRHMDCPVCQTRLKPGAQWLACPNGDGILLTGEQLIRLRLNADPKMLASALKNKEEEGTRMLTCPYCKSSMHLSQYQNTDIYLDICSSCRYRWLDYKEVDTIAGIEKALL